MSTSSFFYKNLPVFTGNFHDILSESNSHYFKILPPEWHIIGTDVKNSTALFSEKKYQEVNFISVGSIGVLLHHAEKKNIKIPFIYGGDGMFGIVPPEILADVMRDLLVLQKNALENFKISLRVSSIPVKDIAFSDPVYVAKHAVSRHYIQAIFKGSGMDRAEYLLKHSEKHSHFFTKENTQYSRDLDLSELYCNWNTIHTPRKKDEVLCLIIKPKNTILPEKVFQDSLKEIARLYGTFTERYPLKKESVSVVNIRTLFKKLALSHSHISLSKILSIILSSLLRFFRFTYNSFIEKYIYRLPSHIHISSDVLKIDDSLKTIFAGDPEKRMVLLEWLDAEEKKGYLTYGLSISETSTLACVLQHKNMTHVRFIDGYGGGYTRAAIELKKKLK